MLPGALAFRRPQRPARGWLQEILRINCRGPIYPG